MLLRHAPLAPLGCFVDSLWYSERGALTHLRERSLPTGCADIVIPLLQDHIVRYDREQDLHAQRLRGGVVQGPHDRFGVRGTEGPSVVVGVHFRPGGAAVFLGGALPHLRNCTVLLEDLWGPAAHELREQLQAAPSPRAALDVLERYLLQCLRDVPKADPVVCFALDTFCADPARARIEPVQRATGCTPAQFIRRFEQAVGLTPKRYTRVLRFGALLPALARCGPRDWAQLAAQAGYYDQSHLIHEFHRLAGITPGAYAPVAPDQPTHVPLAP